MTTTLRKFTTTGVGISAVFVGVGLPGIPLDSTLSHNISWKSLSSQNYNWYFEKSGAQTAVTTKEISPILNPVKSSRKLKINIVRIGSSHLLPKDESNRLRET